MTQAELKALVQKVQAMARKGMVRDEDRQHLVERATTGK